LVKKEPKPNTTGLLKGQVLLEVVGLIFDGIKARAKVVFFRNKFLMGPKGAHLSLIG